MTQHVSAPSRRRAVIASTLSAVLLLLLVALVLSADGTRKAMADRLQALRSANEGRTAGHTDSRMSVRARMLPDHQLLLLHANPAGFVLGGVHMVEDAVDDSKAARQRGARSALAARTSGGPALDPPVMMRLVPPSSRAARAAAEALKRDRARADREWRDAWKRAGRMPIAEKREVQAGWKREWERIQAERRWKAEVPGGKA